MLTYDDNGRRSQKTTGTDVTTYDYDSQGRLKQVETPGHTIDYRHNALGNRVAKLKDGEVIERYLWQDKTTLLATYDGEGNLKQRFQYTLGNTPTTLTQDGATYYLLTDHLGSPRVITDSAGQVIKTIDYDAYGNVIADSNPDFTLPFGFAGGLKDRDTGLIRFGYRDYDPETGRWTARDPIGFAGGDTNLYGYVLGDPVNLSDRKGLLPNLPQGVVDAAAAFGDTISFGATDYIRDLMGTNGAVNKYSTEYSAGEWAGVAYGLAAGGAGLVKAGLRVERGNWKQAGKWVAEKGAKKWHFHYGTAAGLTKHHLPFQFSNWLRNFNAAFKKGSAWSDIFSTVFSGYGLSVADYGVNNIVNCP